MARNIEIKAKNIDPTRLLERVKTIATQGPEFIAQDDTFFHCATGRLKLRAFSDTAGELIFYQRANSQGPKESFYIRTPTSEPTSLRQALTLAYGQLGRVKKQRTLYMVGRTRIHLDLVESLGQFIELEVVLSQSEAVDAGLLEADEIMHQLGIDNTSLIEGAYLDLLVQHH